MVAKKAATSKQDAEKKNHGKTKKSNYRNICKREAFEPRQVSSSSGDKQPMTKKKKKSFDA